MGRGLSSTSRRCLLQTIRGSFSSSTSSLLLLLLLRRCMLCIVLLLHTMRRGRLLCMLCLLRGTWLLPLLCTRLPLCLNSVLPCRLLRPALLSLLGLLWPALAQGFRQ